MKQVSLLFGLFVALITNANDSVAANQFAYFTLAGSNTVSIIDTTTHALFGSPIPVGRSPIGIGITPDGTRAYVANQLDHNVSVIDLSTNTDLVSPIPVGVNPFAVSISADGALVYISNQGPDSVSVISTATNTVIGTISVGSDPVGIAFTTDGSKAYVTNHFGDTVSVVDLNINTQIAAIPVGSFPLGIVAHPCGSKVYAGNNRDHDISQIDTSSDTVTGTNILANKPYGVAITSHGSRLYAADAENGKITVIDTTTNTDLVSPISVGAGTSGIAISPDDKFLYVANQSDDSVSVIDTDPNSVNYHTVIQTILGVGDRPSHIAFQPSAIVHGEYLFFDDGQTDTLGNSITAGGLLTNHCWTRISGNPIATYVEATPGDNEIDLSSNPANSDPAYRANISAGLTGNNVTASFNLNIEELGTGSDSCLIRFVNDQWSPTFYLQLYANRTTGQKFGIDSGGQCGCSGVATIRDWVELTDYSIDMWFDNGKLTVYENDELIGSCQDTCNKTNATDIQIQSNGSGSGSGSTICKFDNFRVWEGSPNDEPVLNQAPELDPIGNKVGNEGQLLEFTITATDPEGDNLTFSATNLPTGATFNTGTATFSWTPGFDDAGNYVDVEFSVTDDGDPIELDLELITITIGNVNRVPVIANPGPQEVLEDELLTFDIVATDPDGDGVTIVALGTPSGAVFDGLNFTWTPSLSQEGAYVVTLVATDDGSPNESSESDVVITVGDNPTPPEQAEDLVEGVIDANFPANIENSYLANLKKVEKFIEQGKIQPAINQLNAFINKVEQDYSQGLVTEVERDYFVSAAQNLINDLS